MYFITQLHKISSLELPRALRGWEEDSQLAEICMTSITIQSCSVQKQLCQFHYHCSVKVSHSNLKAIHVLNLVAHHICSETKKSINWAEHQYTLWGILNRCRSEDRSRWRSQRKKVVSLHTNINRIIHIKVTCPISVKKHAACQNVRKDMKFPRERLPNTTEIYFHPKFLSH